MALCVTAPSSAMNLSKNRLPRLSSPLSGLNRSDFGGVLGFGIRNRAGPSFQVRATCSFNSIDQPILKEALKEPVAFMGGMFAGLLRLDLEEEPLKEWVTRTVEASGVTVENADGGEGLNPEEVPQQIEIE
ncbi:UPF0426 protein At1g28150, chloroplastic [Euphorbia lathyris]|uniref:UPF0426 protein At1g28150, chloroplastic n=1 Tax=Euphorbia lathyris TaxID=212925 RepID=UPI0033141E33